MSATGTIGCPNCGEPLTLDPQTHTGHMDGACIRGNRAERFVQKQRSRLSAQRAREREALIAGRLAKRGSEATQADRIALAEAKRQRKANLRRSRG